jgi:hypothetical protein
MPRTETTSIEDKSWVEEEMAGCQFGDPRLAKRATNLIEKMAAKVGESIPTACQDWASTKAAYRFFDNESVSEADVLSGHFLATKQRIAEVGERVLILHDTTEFSYKREGGEMGLLGKLPKYTARGILMHSSLVVTTEGLPLGLAAIKFWTREKFKDCNALEKKLNRTRVPIEVKESYRWLENLRQATALSGTPESCVHIGDRESDIYELFSLASELGTRFLVRTCVDRLTGTEGVTMAEEMEEAAAQGVHRIEFKDRHGADHQATLDLKFRQIEVHPPKGKKSRCKPLMLMVIHAVERGVPEGREPIVWKLLTNLPVRSCAEAIEKLDWYALRWRIEVFHKILKSGCKAEESKLRDSERLANFIAVCCIVAWRVFWLTMIKRTAPDAPASVALTETELKVLNAVVKPLPRGETSSPHTLSSALLKLARLGGYLARANDPPPGTLVIWRGLSRLTDLHLGFLAARETCG